MAVDVRQAIIAALEAEDQLFVVEAQEVHHCGLEVVDVHLVLHDLKAEWIRLAVADTGLRAAAGHED